MVWVRSEGGGSERHQAGDCIEKNVHSRSSEKIESKRKILLLDLTRKRKSGKAASSVETHGKFGIPLKETKPAKEWQEKLSIL